MNRIGDEEIERYLQREKGKVHGSLMTRLDDLLLDLKDARRVARLKCWPCNCPSCRPQQEEV